MYVCILLILVYVCAFVTAIIHIYIYIYDMVYLITAIWLTPGGSSTVHIYTQTVH
jgi:hypothetical protein